MSKIKVNGKSDSEQVGNSFEVALDIDREIDERIIEIFRQIKSFNLSHSGKSNTINLELADLVNLVQQVQDYQIPHGIESLEVATQLLIENHNVEAFNVVSKHLHERLQKYRNCFKNPLFFLQTRIRSWSAPSKLIFGLLFALYVTYLPLLFSLTRLIQIMSKLDTTLLTLAGLGGGSGSVTSTLLRIRDFQFSPKEDLLVPLFTGFFKPAIGTLFGMFLFCLIESNILKTVVVIDFPDQSDNQRKEYAILAYSFVAGFSERFTRDIIGKFNMDKKV